MLGIGRASFLALTLSAFYWLLLGSALAAPRAKVPVEQKNGKTKKVTCQYKASREKWRRKKKRGNRSRGGSFNRQAKKACGGLIGSSSVKKLGQLPSSGGVISSKFSSFRGGLSSSFRAVSGIPPAIPQIPNQDIASLFWRDGVVDRIANGNPTFGDCNEFFGGNTDGHSAGLAGCFMAEQTGRGLEDALRSAVSLCYMKSIPALSGGAGVTLVSGGENLPDGDGSKIFDTPAGASSRLVEVQVTGIVDGPGGEGAVMADDSPESIFIQVFGEDANKNSKQQYSYNIFFCDKNSQTLTSVETGGVGLEGKAQIMNRGSDEQGVYESVLEGYFTEKEGAIKFNPSMPRALSISFIDQVNNFVEKSNLSFTSFDRIKVKNYSVTEGRRGFGVVGFTGSGVADARLFEGAYKDEKEGNSSEAFSALVEFRDTRYLAAPGSDLQKELNKVDLLSDPFYTAPQVSFNSGEFDCSTQADVVVALDFTAPPLQILQQQCEGEIVQDQDFCEGDPLVNQALNNFESACFGNDVRP